MIGERLAEIRKDRGMTQKELAKFLSVSATTISGYERNKKTPCDDTKVRIARLFNISLDYLLGANDEELALDRSNVVILPKDFPIEVREDVIDYADLMVLKHRHHEKSSTRV